jgi:hypothetical protein
MSAFNLKNPSLWAIILGNIFSMIIAYSQSWPLYQALYVYWGQSVIIGLINFYRMRSLKTFSTKGLTMNDVPVPENEAGKKSVSSFFLIHYGGFHFVYFMFLWTENPLFEVPTEDIMLTLLCVAGFFSSHSYSRRYNAKLDFKQKKPNLGTLMFYPYLRIVPMHLVIILGSQMDGYAVLLFMGLKTFADAGMHMVEHHLFQKPDKNKYRIED